MVFPLMFSCGEWLDVKPKSEIKSETMFETEQGFKDAITGCYIAMSDPSLYGGELTLTFLEVLGQQFELYAGTGSRYFLAQQYAYNDYTREIDAIWGGIYNVIANVNNVIENLEVKREVLHPTNYAVFKAEMHALRAFLHLDLVRLFTWGDLADRGQQLLDKPAIPYVTAYDKVITKQHTLGEVLAFIREDVELSLELFEVWDPMSISDMRPNDYEIPNEDLFYENDVRVLRMNIKAAMATRMRLNMWEGDYRAALADATYLIEELTVPWMAETNITDEEEAARDRTFSTEQLFGVETFQRFDNVVTPYYKTTVTTGTVDNMNYNALFLSDTRANMLYEVDAMGDIDYRLTQVFDRNVRPFQFLKFWEYENSAYINRMPLIRKPEIYYTATECLLKTGGSREQAIDCLNQVRNNRGLWQAPLAMDLSTEQVWQETEKEWRKEFLGEGQMFYFYKRLGYTNIPNYPLLASDAVYLLPLPETEVDFGGRFAPSK